MWLQEGNVEGRRMLEKGSQEGQEAREEFLVAGWHIGCWQSYWGLQVNERDLVSTSWREVSKLVKGGIWCRHCQEIR